MRIASKTKTTDVAEVSYDLGTEIVAPESSLILGSTNETTLNHAWDAGIMEAWVFDSSILTSPTRLAAIDAYVGEIYFA